MKQRDADHVAGNVRAEVARKRLRQAQMATALGMTQQALSRRMTGDVEFSASEVQAIANLLGVPVADLMTAPAIAASA